MTRNKVKSSVRGILKSFKNGKFYKLLVEKGALCFLISFFIPAYIMLQAFKDVGIHPFGDQQMLVVDLWHQYFPFFRVLREKLLSGGSLLYSWENGLGTNFLSLMSYYEASPLNLLSVFFNDDQVRDALTYFIIAKIGFAGAFFSCFLRYTYKRTDISCCAFSVMYALCSYTLGYYWNVMWFDTIALFPLVMTGIVAICREGKWRTFTFALALSLISNYYIGYFTCIFSVFMFAAAGIIECKSIKDFFIKLFITARSAVLGIALGGFILLPAYYGLQLTNSVRNSLPKTITFYEKWTDIFANMLSYSEPTKVEGLPNFACGMLALMLFGVFLFTFRKSEGIKIREKVSVLLMLAIIAVSCNMNLLNFIWHGFHFTNQIPYRFAFIFSFVLVTAAYRAYDILIKTGIRMYHLTLMLLFPMVIILLNYFSMGDEFSITKPIKRSLIITCAFLLIFIAIKVFTFKNAHFKKTVMSLALTAAVFSEFLSNAKIGVQTVGSTGYLDYPAKAEAVQTFLDDIRSTDTTPFYRTEMTETYTLNDSALYGYYGVSQFSSAANVSVTTFTKRLGLQSSEAGNRYCYRIATPVVNSLLGIKYIIKKGSALNTEEMALEHLNTKDTSHLYENRYPLSLGFMMNENILEMEDSGGLNPFEYQNEIIRRATNTEESVFMPQPVALVKYNGMEVTKNGYGNYTFRSTSENSIVSATYSFDGLEDSYLYGYASSTGSCDTIVVQSNGSTIENGKLIESYPVVFPMGNGQEGITATVEIRTKEDVKSGNYKLMIYALSQPAFERAYEALADEQLIITKFDDTEITGTVNALEDGVLFLSFPYEKGWSVYVDGKKTETFSVMQSMLGVKVSSGSHEIRLKYTPEGFVLGTAASFASLSVIIALMLIDRARRKKQILSEAAVSDEGSEPEGFEFVYTEGEAPDIYNQAQEDGFSINIPDSPPVTEEADNEKSEGDDSLQGD